MVTTKHSCWGECKSDCYFRPRDVTSAQRYCILKVKGMCLFLAVSKIFGGGGGLRVNKPPCLYMCCKIACQFDGLKKKPIFEVQDRKNETETLNT